MQGNRRSKVFLVFEENLLFEKSPKIITAEAEDLQLPEDLEKAQPCKKYFTAYLYGQEQREKPEDYIIFFLCGFPPKEMGGRICAGFVGSFGWFSAEIFCEQWKHKNGPKLLPSPKA